MTSKCARSQLIAMLPYPTNKLQSTTTTRHRRRNLNTNPVKPASTSTRSPFFLPLPNPIYADLVPGSKSRSSVARLQTFDTRNSPSFFKSSLILLLLARLRIHGQLYTSTPLHTAQTHSPDRDSSH